MVSETEAIAELSCTREYPSLIHYAARYGQVTVIASLNHHVINLARPTAPAWTGLRKSWCLSAGEGLAVVASVHAGTGHLSG